MTREQFDAAIRKLDERIPSLADHEIIVELMRIVAMIGDGHTGVRADQKFTSLYPLRLYLFNDGLFVRAAAPQYREAVGARVVKIGNTDTAQALRAVSEIVWRDNEMGVKAIAPMLLVVPEVLHALRLSDALQKAEFVVEKDGRQTRIELKPSAQFNHLRQPPSDWIDAARTDAKTPTPVSTACGPGSPARGPQQRSAAGVANGQPGWGGDSGRVQCPLWLKIRRISSGMSI